MFFSFQTAFFRQHGCTTTDANAKYNSRAAQMYREKIRQLASAAMAKYGTDVSPSSSVLLRCVVLHAESCRISWFFPSPLFSCL